MRGALVGDAAGATPGFLDEKLDRDEVKRSLGLCGGGVWRTAPGQITDDSEMAPCLARELAGSASFSIEKVACEYLMWYRSLPFDMGRTTAAGLEGGLKAEPGTVHRGMWKAAEVNSSSKANGALMRAAPLGIWGWRINEEEVADAASAECRLTHANTTCQSESAVYCQAIRHLVLNPGDGVGALHGESDIPSALTAAVMGCDTSKGRSRPEWLQTRVQLPRLMDALLASE